MIKFMLGTFAVLGFAFYQLSGGADFEPRRALALDEVETETLVSSNEPVIDKEPVPQVTRISVDLTSVTATVPQGEPLMVDPQKAETVIVPEVPEPGTPEVAAVPQSETETAAIVPSLVKDVRKVSGNRVNIRSGPGTSYGVVTQLTRGVPVEVMHDNGDGWVKMRPLDGGQVGWIAAFLLTDAQG